MLHKITQLWVWLSECWWNFTVIVSCFWWCNMSKLYISHISKGLQLFSLGKLRSCSPRTLLPGVYKAVSQDKKAEMCPVSVQNHLHGDSSREHFIEFIASFQETLIQPFRRNHTVYVPTLYILVCLYSWCREDRELATGRYQIWPDPKLMEPDGGL